MKKWELARYIIDSKKAVDSIMYISENIEDLTNLKLRDIIYEKLETFYVKIRIVYDKSFARDEKKELAQKDVIYKETLYESDKNYAHKDDKYEFKKVESFTKIIETLKEQLIHCRELCKDTLPENLTLDFIPYDYNLFRFVNNITPRKEEMLKDILYVKHEREKIDKNDRTLNIFHDTEEIKFVRDINEYGVVIENGINLFEGLQNRQDACIKINVLFEQNIWCNVKGNLIELEKNFEKLCKQMQIY